MIFLSRGDENVLYWPLQEILLMAVIDLPNIVMQRLRDITKQNPSMKAEDIYFEGETGLWCLITISNGDGRTVEYDFIESEQSWNRTEVAVEYAQAAMEQARVLVIVPDEALPDVLELVKGYGADGVRVTDYRAMELVPFPLTY
jgi:hypothetical protein